MARKQKAPDEWRKEQQDPVLFQRLELLGDILLFVSVVIAAGFYFNPSVPWLLACLGCLVTSFSLALFLPAYFTLLDVRKENKKGPQYGITLSGVLGFSCVPLLTRQYYQVSHEWQLVLAALVLMVVVMILLLRFTVDKMDSLAVIISILFVGICGYCGLNHVNALMDFSEPIHYQTIVLKQNISSTGRRGQNYYCVVEEENGEEVSIEISEEVYSQIECGETVCLDIHPGALGIEYMDIHLLS